MPDRLALCQRLKRQEAAASRRVLARAKRGRGIEHDAEGASWDPAAVMRAINKEAPNANRRKGELVFRKPVAGCQPFFAKFVQFAAGADRG